MIRSSAVEPWKQLLTVWFHKPVGDAKLQKCLLSFKYSIKSVYLMFLGKLLFFFQLSEQLNPCKKVAVTTYNIDLYFLFV